MFLIFIRSCMSNVTNTNTFSSLVAFTSPLFQWLPTFRLEVIFFPKATEFSVWSYSFPVYCIYYFTILTSTVAFLLRNLLWDWLQLLTVNSFFSGWSKVFICFCACVHAHLSVKFFLFFIIRICLAPWFSRFVSCTKFQIFSTPTASNTCFSTFFYSFSFMTLQLSSELSTLSYISLNFY